MAGWVSIHRSLSDHWLWKEEKFSKAQAWVDLILNANHKQVKTLIKGQLVTIERGQQARSEVTLSKLWGWSRDKVRRFLKLLEHDGMIRQQKTNVTSIITICNYSQFQDGDTAVNTPNDTAEKHQAIQQANIKQDTNNNVNNENNDNKETSLVTTEPPPNKSKFKFDSEDIRFAEEMHKKIQQTNPSAPKPNFENWANTIRLMRERDGLTHKDMWLTFSWANGDHFWYQNIESPTKLRKHFSRLNNERMKSNEGNGSGISKQGRKLTAEEELHERLLRDYGAAPSQWESGQPTDNGMGQCGIHGSVPSQVEEGSVTIDMGDGSISPNS